VSYKRVNEIVDGQSGKMPLFSLIRGIIAVALVANRFRRYDMGWCWCEKPLGGDVRPLWGLNVLVDSLTSSC